jgi:hypothetical protein
VDVDGVGAWLYFFSKIHHNWTMRLEFGAVAGVHIEHSGSDADIVDVSSILAILTGVQYHLLSPRLSTRIQPYISGGIGPYWHHDINVENNQTMENVLTEGYSTFGGYLGGGVNIPITSFFGLNFDIKYHFVDFNIEKDLSGVEFGFGFSFMFGKRREMFRIKETRLLVRDIYPAIYQFYNTYPLALVKVENSAGYPIEVNIRSTIDPYSTRPNDSGFIRIEKGETKDLAATAVFSPDISRRKSRGPAKLNIEVEGRAGSIHRREVSAQLTVHSRNSWNGEMDKLIFFVTPDDQKILNLSRKIAGKLDKTEPNKPRNLLLAEAIFEELKNMNIRYQSDPNIPFYKDDRVQFASETIELQSGDCDDLVVLFSSMLESLGINTAFVREKNTEEKTAHLYLLLDTGIDESKANMISSNEKRYIIRNKNQGKQNVWIPVETTLIVQGFEEAWKSGALNYLEEVGLNRGLDKGLIQIINVD